MEFQVKSRGKGKKKVFSPCMYKLPLHYFNLFERLVKQMSMHLKDKSTQDIFYSLLTGADVIEVSEKYNISMNKLAFIYEKALREVSESWENMIQERLAFQSADIQCRNYMAVLRRNNLACEQTRVIVPVKGQEIPVEYVEKLSTSLECLEIQPRILRNLRKHNIYVLEDLLRFIKGNGFDALRRLPGIGIKSSENLLHKLKERHIMESKDTCHLFRYIYI